MPRPQLEDEGFLLEVQMERAPWPVPRPVVLDDEEGIESFEALEAGDTLELTAHGPDGDGAIDTAGGDAQGFRVRRDDFEPEAPHRVTSRP